jgi:alkylhydroperoxidase family enzyme
MTQVQDRTTTRRYQAGKLPRNPAVLEPQTAFKQSVYAMDNVDPIVRELVRMRNGIIQECKYCMSLRSGIALDQGLTEDMMQSIHDYEQADLTERQKVAVRFADAYLLHPSELSDELRADVQKHFSTAEILELTLRLTHNTINRLNSAMNTHREVDGIEVTREF